MRVQDLKRRTTEFLNFKYFYGNSLLDGAINSMKGANIYLLLLKDMEEESEIKMQKIKNSK